MTTRDQKLFFTIFEIEPEQEITDQIILELICILSRCFSVPFSRNAEELRKEVFRSVINRYADLNSSTQFCHGLDAIELKRNVQKIFRKD